MIPTLTLGVPGSNIAALMLGALLIQGFQPGPQLFRDAPEIVYGYSWQMFITSALLIVFGGIVASRVFANILRIPQAMLLPLIICMVVAGSFAAENSMFDVYMAFLFGLVGLGMVRFGFPIAPVDHRRGARRQGGVQPARLAADVGRRSVDPLHPADLHRADRPLGAGAVLSGPALPEGLGGSGRMGARASCRRKRCRARSSRLGKRACPRRICDADSAWTARPVSWPLAATRTAVAC